MVPCELIASAAIGDLCACIMLTAVRETVSKIMILPTEEDGAGGGCVDKGDVADGVGAGYAKNAFSLDGDNAQIAVTITQTQMYLACDEPHSERRGTYH